ncbi:hypothetical protein ACIBF6_40305 [Streptosporangium amethystogenes]
MQNLSDKGVRQRPELAGRSAMDWRLTPEAAARPRRLRRRSARAAAMAWR